MPPQILSYAAPGIVYKPRTSRLAVLAMLLPFLPFVVDGVLFIVWYAMRDPGNGIGNLVGFALLALVGAVGHIAIHIAAVVVCIVARSRIRAAPERYRRLWVGTLAAFACYGIVSLEGVAIAMYVFILR